MITTSFVRSSDGKVLDVMHLQNTAHALQVLNKAGRSYSTVFWLIPVVAIVAILCSKKRKS
jgi:hypothetical protein